MCQHRYGGFAFCGGPEADNDQQQAGRQCVCALRKRICYTHTSCCTTLKGYKIIIVAGCALCKKIKKKLCP